MARNHRSSTNRLNYEFFSYDVVPWVLHPLMVRWAKDQEGLSPNSL